MKTIWKFPLSPDKLTIEMPRGAKVLSVAVQDEVICVWALVDTEAALVKRRFYVLGTGHDASAVTSQIVCLHVGIVLMDGGSLVFHVFVEHP